MGHDENKQEVKFEINRSYYHLGQGGTDIVEGFENLLFDLDEEKAAAPDDTLLQKLGDVTLRQVAEGAYNGVAAVASVPRKNLSRFLDKFQINY